LFIITLSVVAQFQWSFAEPKPYQGQRGEAPLCK